MVTWQAAIAEARQDAARRRLLDCYRAFYGRARRLRRVYKEPLDVAALLMDAKVAAVALKALTVELEALADQRLADAVTVVVDAVAVAGLLPPPTDATPEP